MADLPNASSGKLVFVVFDLVLGLGLGLVRRLTDYGIVLLRSFLLLGLLLGFVIVARKTSIRLRYATVLVLVVIYRS